MSTNFPTTLTTYTNPTITDQVGLDVGGRTHDEFHSDNNDDIEALQAKVGVDGSAVTTTHDYKLSGVTGSDKAASKTGTETLTNKTLTAPVIAASTMTGIQDATGATLNVTDSTFSIKDNSDPTKVVQFQASGITAGQTRTKTFQDVSGTIYESGGTDVAIADGGTGQSTATLGFNALSPLTTKGDIVVHNGTNNIRLAAGSDTNVLIADSSTASGLKWGAPSASNILAVSTASKGASTGDSYTLAIPGGTLGTANVIHYRMIVSNLTMTGGSADDVTIAVTYGGSSVGSVTISPLGGAGTLNSDSCQVEGYVFASGATNTQLGQLMTVANVPTASGTTFATVENNYQTAAVDSTSNQDLVITLSRSNNGNLTARAAFVAIV